MIKGQIISGGFGKILAREKAGKKLEIGELLVADTASGKIIMQVYDLLYGSQISQQNLELVSGMMMEEGSDLRFMDENQRNYNLAFLKNLVQVNDEGARLVKEMPSFFGQVREVTSEDLRFLVKPTNSIFFGNLRSGSKELDVPVYLDGEKVLSHHVLIAATTGRGKSNLTANMLWDSIDKAYCGILVLDPHDEYYGRNKIGLKDHPEREKVVYYTPKNPPAGARTLKLHLSQIKPEHFHGVIEWSLPQVEALRAYYNKYREKWIESVMLEMPVENFHEGTLGVVKRRLMQLLSLDASEGEVLCKGVFDSSVGETTIKDICSELELGKKVIVDTSSFSGSVEILIGSLICTELFDRYKYYKTKGVLRDKPVISVVLEEAPRVLGKEVLEKGPNIFSTIAREGRKFRVGLCAITQLPSLIPRQILANMNTKIILGIEMKPERTAIIESASQDLSEDDRNIASLDVGEAIVTSNFSKFAIPIKIPLFENVAKSQKNEVKKEFVGVGQ